MKKIRILFAGFLCMNILLFSGTADNTYAAELPNTQEFTDTRPDYVLYVNRALNCITVKQKGPDGTLTPVKAMVCSCGCAGRETPENLVNPQ